MKIYRGIISVLFFLQFFGLMTFLHFIDAIMMERIQYGSFFVIGANADFPFWLCYLVGTFVELDTQLVPHLGNIEGVNIEAILLFDIGLDDGIGGNRASILA